jgi:hypothetical protein
MRPLQSTLLALACLTLAPSALAQLTPICSETFEYPFPGLIDGQTGGQGWANAWAVSPNVDDLVIQANPPTNATNPFPWTADDGVGHYLQQSVEFGGALRKPDQTGHSEIISNGLFGKDGSTIWVSFTIWNFQQFGDHFGALSFWEGNNPTWRIGSIWGIHTWGVDYCPGFGCFTYVNGSSDAVAARLVTRIDYLAGQDRVRMWIDPAETHPTDNPDLDTLIADHPWDNIRLWSGGNGALYYWDDIVIERGVPVPPVLYCFGDEQIGSSCPCGNPGQIGQGCANSTGQGAVIAETGSPGVIADDFGVDATHLAPSQPALLFSANNAVNSGNGVIFGDGLRCAGGSVKRLGVRQADAAGHASWNSNLSVSGGWTAGDTRRFQVWYRDPTGAPCGTGFNLSHGLERFFSLY